MARILSYLRSSDLLSCTRVSSVWEAEARKYLLKNTPTTPICCSNVDKYFATMATRGVSHSTLKLSTCSQESCLESLVTTLRGANCLQKVVSLATDWTPDVEWGQDFLLWTSFTAMTRLELRTHCPTVVFVDELRRYFRIAARNYLRRYSTKEPLTFPSVLTLSWGFSEAWMDEEGWSEPIQASLVQKESRFFQM